MLVLVSSLFSFVCIYAGAGILFILLCLYLRWCWYPLFILLSVFTLVLVSSLFSFECVYALLKCVMTKCVMQVQLSSFHHLVLIISFVFSLVLVSWCVHAVGIKKGLDSNP